MTILTNISFAAVFFGWDATSPTYSTSGQYDPAKVHVAGGHTSSCYVDFDVQKTDVDFGNITAPALPVVDPRRQPIVGKSEA